MVWVVFPFEHQTHIAGGSAALKCRMTSLAEGHVVRPHVVSTSTSDEMMQFRWRHLSVPEETAHPALGMLAVEFLGVRALLPCHLSILPLVPSAVSRRPAATHLARLST